MRAKRTILLTLGISVVVVAIVAVVSFIIIEQRSTEQGGDVDLSASSSEFPPLNGVARTERDIAILEAYESGEGPSFDQYAVEVEPGRLSADMDLSSLAYDHTTGFLYAVEAGGPNPIIFQDELRTTLALDHDFFEDLEVGTWFTEGTEEGWTFAGDWQNEDGVDGIVAFTNDELHGFFPGLRDPQFDRNGRLLAINEGRASTTIEILSLEQETAQELITLPGNPAFIELYGGTSEALFYERFDDAGRSFVRLSLENGEETVLVEGSRSVEVAPTQDTFVVEQQEANAQLFRHVNADGVVRPLALPSDVLPFFTWGKDGQRLFVLAGQVQTIPQEEQEEVDAFVPDPLAKEIWQIDPATNEQVLAVTLPVETPVSSFFLDVERGLILLYSQSENALTRYTTSDTRGGE